MKTPFEIIMKPIITEKSSAGQELEYPQYTFKARKDANKYEVRSAIETAFPGVKVRSVNAMIVKGKQRRQRNKVGRTPDWKKVIVTLEKGNVIELY